MSTVALRNVIARRIESLGDNTATLALFSSTLFLSAILLFSVQPVFAKIILPTLGGSPSVWAVSMCFFQAALLAGYCYAYALNRYMPLEYAPLAHVALLALAFLALPFGLPEGVEPPAGDAYLWLIGVLTLGVGLPFFCSVRKRAIAAGLVCENRTPACSRSVLSLWCVEPRITARAFKLSRRYRAAVWIEGTGNNLDRRLPLISPVSRTLWPPALGQIYFYWRRNWPVWNENPSIRANDFESTPNMAIQTNLDWSRICPIWTARCLHQLPRNGHRFRTIHLGHSVGHVPCHFCPDIPGHSNHPEALAPTKSALDCYVCHSRHRGTRNSARLVCNRTRLLGIFRNDYGRSRRSV